MHNITCNDTGIEPAPGFILAELITIAPKSGLVLPHSVERSEALEATIILQDNRRVPEQKPAGTRVICGQGIGLGVLKPRRLVFIREEEVLGFAKEPLNT
ncbi:MAG: hypothetical protein E6Q97_30390 [Desulfurellales bacterium]|nr:MAG: hypothetical protein E6Q97_30390 [Desulfurellales bacterium]